MFNGSFYLVLFNRPTISGVITEERRLDLGPQNCWINQELGMVFWGLNTLSPPPPPSNPHPRFHLTPDGARVSWSLAVSAGLRSAEIHDASPNSLIIQRGAAWGQEVLPPAEGRGLMPALALPLTHTLSLSSAISFSDSGDHGPPQFPVSCKAQ